MIAKRKLLWVITCQLIALWAIRCSSGTPNIGGNARATGGSPGVFADAGARDSGAQTGGAGGGTNIPIPDASDAGSIPDAARPNPCSLGPLYQCDASLANPILNCDVTDFGAVGDGTTDDTCAIQDALDFCGQIAKCHSKIATVHIPPGKYLVLPLVLRSNVTMQFDGAPVDGGTVANLDAGLDGTATLQFVPDPSKYQSSGGVPIVPGLINGTTVTNVTITGQGIIDGAGAAWWALFDSTWSPAGIDPRPYLISFVNNSSNLTISGVTLVNSPKFHVFFQNCTNIDVHGITIRAPSNSPNTDGIDPKSCTHVSISDCDISTGDDNVAISSNSRTGFAPPTSNFTEVFNCRFGAGHGVSIGSPTYGDVGGMNVHDCTFDGTTNGIRIKSNATSGGIVEGITYNNIQMTNVTNVIVLDGYYSDKAKIPPLDGGTADAGATPVTPTANEPEFRNIRISNVTATNCGTAGIIRGRIESLIYDVTLENVNISANKGMTIRFAEGIHFVNSTITTPAGIPPINLQVDPSAVTGIDAMLDAAIP
jgi:polygalacturonase